MMASKEQVKTAVQLFVDRDLMGKGTTSQKFMTFMAANLLLNRIDNMWPTITNNGTAAVLGLVDEDGRVDAGALLASAKEAMKKTGAINLAGIIFSENDINSFENYLNEVVAG